MSKPSKRHDEVAPQATIRRYRSRGVDVEIRETTVRPVGKDPHTGTVELTLDGVPIPVSAIDGQYHSQLANQFTAFGTIDDVVETLLDNEGRTWTLHSGGGHNHGTGGGR